MYLRLSVLFQWFLTALSVRPGSSLEMTARGGVAEGDKLGLGRQSAQAACSCQPPLQLYALKSTRQRQCEHPAALSLHNQMQSTAEVPECASTAM